MALALALRGCSSRPRVSRRVAPPLAPLCTPPPVPHGPRRARTGDGWKGAEAACKGPVLRRRFGSETSSHLAPLSAGVAYASKISFTDIGPGDAPFLDVPNDLANNFFNIDYDNGARIHTNSWGVRRAVARSNPTHPRPGSRCPCQICSAALVQRYSSSTRFRNKSIFQSNWT